MTLSRETLADSIESAIAHTGDAIISGDNWSIVIAALRAPGRLDCGAVENELRKHLKIGGHDAWEGHYYFVDGIKAAAAAILALSHHQTGDGEVRCPTCGRTDETYLNTHMTCPDPWHGDDHLRAKATPLDRESLGIKLHVYSPDYQAMGDCRVCGHGQDKPWHLHTPVKIEHDGFEGTIIGSYVTREGKRGVVLQQMGTRVVHVYGEKWLDTDKTSS